MKKNFKKKLFQYVIGKNERLDTRELFELYKSGIITDSHIEPLLRGEGISTEEISTEGISTDV